jgi:WD40 repeat protein
VIFTILNRQTKVHARLTFLVASVLCAPALHAADAPGHPMLRIETGSHSAPIRALSSDTAGQYAVTAAEDKTARVWEAASGRLLQVLRPPIGTDAEGKLYAVAISGDGEYIATGGWSKNNDVYIFRRTSGQLAHRITGLPNVIAHLAFAPGGKALLVSLWDKHGIRLYASADNWQSSRETAIDSDYAGDTYGADFSGDGKRLVTTSFDGFVRLYDVAGGALRLLKRARLEAGYQPFTAAFSPDQSKIAVSLADRAAVAVLHADTLETAYSPSVEGIDNGNVSALAWSHDGQQLLAAGTWKRPDAKHGLRRWSKAGKGAHADTSLAGNTIVALRLLPSGKMLFASADPAWGNISATGEGKISSSASLIDFRGSRDTFRLARDGNAAGFGQPAGKAGASGFDIAKLEWVAPLTQWLRPTEKSRGLYVEEWFQGARPFLNRRPLALDQHEIALSVAVDESHAVLGTSFRVRYFSNDGTELWHADAPGSTWQVNLSADGRWVVAGFSDGTLRWYRARDGAEQLALLPHADRKRWILWTPQGYYAASVGGEDLIGWHVNRGAARAADFFPGSRFRATFYRPDVIARILVTADVEKALLAANEAASNKTQTARIETRLPPVIGVISPGDGSNFSSNEIKIGVTLRAPADAPVRALRARVNGKLVELAGKPNLSRPDGAKEEELKIEVGVPLPAQDAEIMLFAENQHGFSTPAVLRLKWSAGVPAATSPASVAPRIENAPDTHKTENPADTRPALYVLAVGVSKYRDTKIALEYASKDASDFANVWAAQQGRLYRKVVVKQLTDANATRDGVLDGLEWIRRETTSRDVGVVFLAGHGVNDNDGTYYYLPQDVDVDKLKRTGVIFTEIRNTLSTLPGKALFFIDTCHSGNAIGTGRRSALSDLTAVVNELSSAENGVIVFAASTGKQYAQESAEWRNGVFTKSLLEGLTGKADLAKSGRVTHKMLDLYASERVKALTKGSQSPVTIVPNGVPDFPIAISKP